MKHRSILAGAIALAIAAAAGAAPDTRYLPPPGLYQIDIVADHASHGAAGTSKQRKRYDGTSGGVETQFQRTDGSRGSYATAGAGPNQTCIEPVKPGGIPKKLMVDGCTATKGVVTNGEMNAVHTCPWGSMKINMRQIDAKTWQTTVQQVKTGNGDAGNGEFVDPLQMPMEHMLKHGTAEEKAEAKRHFAEMKEFKEQMKNAPPPEPMPAGAVREQKSVMRLTRIGDCKG
ncbi:hypothetical protein QPK31_20340 [Massilia sp. YIM B02769]|uniref:hypothetical protein n=1 Tax=unclassified Massilia TaxID=2609279 RepID=UPI0025B66A95|nr:MULTISPECIES: hypothetical protein [unclassified Massilia]MDN4060564.1 hypothetical protein [Massilia sp. YIM B02769]